MVNIDKSKCIPCGYCYGTYPDVFELGSDGKAQVKKKELSADDKKIYDEAKSGCPVGAIE